MAREMTAKDPRYAARDVFWHAANRAVLVAIQRNDWGRASGFYFSMALTEYKESNEDAFNERVLMLQREANLAELRSLAADGYLKRVDILTCDCSVCSKGRKKGLRIDQELKEPTIPHAGCREGWCTCDYSPAD